MPRRDGTGPDGRGPCTGRGLGPCRCDDRPAGPEAADAAAENPEGTGSYRGPVRRGAPRRPIRRQAGPWNSGEPIREQIDRLQESLDALRHAIGKKETE